MGILRVLCLCLLVVCAVQSEEADQAAVSDGVDEKSCPTGDGGVCKAESEATDGEAPEAKYAAEKQEQPKEEVKESAPVQDKTDGEAKKEEEKEEKEKKPRKGEEERHLVKIEVLEEGKMCDRIKATNDDAVTVHMRGVKASDGSEFITTYNEDGSEGLSIPFRMGVGDSIKGLELGVIDMCIDEMRRITVPASLVRNGREEFKGDKIPRGEDLIFEVRLLGAVPNYQKGMPNMFKKFDINKDGVIQREEMYDSIVGDGQMFPRGSEIVDILTDEQIEKADKNEDGVIQWEEFNLPKWDEM